MSAIPLGTLFKNAPVLAASAALPITGTTPDVADVSLSPSLGGRNRGNAAAFEVKFLLSEETAQQVEKELGGQMQLDPYANPATGNAYQISSTYLDTPRLDVFHGVGRHRFRKFRLRRYGEANWSYLEQKTKRKDQVRKARSKTDLPRLSLLAAPLTLEAWDGAWFHRQVMRWSLSPTCQVTYLRRAYFGENAGSPIRLTFDRQVKSRQLAGWSMAAASEEVELGASEESGEVICEFKFRGAMPICFKRVVSELGLPAQNASKYRRSLKTLGVDRSADHA